ncbi:hypothetical protein PFICI_15245 [Pestalotiopsis fici W106-1]|uniref:Uncharacterized protein n=1 Tax=Pestalotiopsis fici (strain W106-1 / CGMCC3.15140) TaxID=1229662 RepID=W3WGL6_PESFW|nr:uncharacterized protein PFICI_15245 [Pestalotiopsis fici W106-1]ETS73070.1 hypothetical protein PFICI_15245 [Pestalotiopsis fici W106-1]
MDVSLLQSNFAASPDYRFWRPPQLVCYQGNGPQGTNIVTAGGLIQSGNHFYLVVVDDLSLLGWSSCATTSSSTKLKDHRRCLTMTRHINYHRSSQEIVGIIGHLVHFSIDQGYGLVRLKSEWIRNDLEAIKQDAIPVDSFHTYLDTPIVMDFVEFVTAGGEQVTGVVIAQQSFCVEAGNSKRKVEALVVNTSSYSVRPEDCGTWVRRSVASNRPFLLGHIIGSSDDGGSTMLVLPFTHFREDLRQVVRRRAFNLSA